MSANGVTRSSNMLPGFLKDAGTYKGFTVQKCLSQWYHFLKKEHSAFAEPTLFPGKRREDVCNKLKNDLQQIPALLMEELVNDDCLKDKGQYLRLVQALLINTSDVLQTDETLKELCVDAENVLQFIQDFFYQHFDFDYRVSAYCFNQFKTTYHLKLDYWKLKLQQPSVIDSLLECINEKMILPGQQLNFHKLNYLQLLFQHLQTTTSILNETYVRDLLMYSNFNSPCYTECEIKLIREKITDETSLEGTIALLRQEDARLNQLKIKQGMCFDASLPSLKKQLHDWIGNEIKHLELMNQRKADKDLLIDTESKIQTSLSVAKLAVMIRLMVADKIIINKSIAPMLRTVAKLFTTLQKDEISFGSLETKYHAPDKATLNIMKDTLVKWSSLISRL